MWVFWKYDSTVRIELMFFRTLFYMRSTVGYRIWPLKSGSNMSNSFFFETTVQWLLGDQCFFKKMFYNLFITIIKVITFVLNFECYWIEEYLLDLIASRSSNEILLFILICQYSITFNYLLALTLIKHCRALQSTFFFTRRI